MPCYGQGQCAKFLKIKPYTCYLGKAGQAACPWAAVLAYGYYKHVLGTRQPFFANIFTVTGTHNFLLAYALKGRGQPENFDFLKLYVHNTHYNYHMEQLPWPETSN